MSENTETAPIPSRKIATLFAGHVETVTLLDGSPLRLRVHRLPVSRHIKFIDKAMNEAELIELACTEIPGEAMLEPGWADALDHDSHVRLIGVVLELNLARAIATVRRANETSRELVSLASSLVLRPPTAS